jgi:hypothetical protein
MNKTDSLWMVSRILSLIEELPILAQGSKTVEIKTQLKLLTGYLRALGSKDSAALAASASLRRSLRRKWRERFSNWDVGELFPNVD